MRAADQTPSEKLQDGRTSFGHLAALGASVLAPMWLAVLLEPKLYSGLLAAGLLTAAVVFIVGVGCALSARAVSKARLERHRPALTDLDGSR